MRYLRQRRITQNNQKINSSVRSVSAFNPTVSGNLYSTLDFEWNKKSRELVAEASSLGNAFRISAPRSMKIKSSRTGRIINFINSAVIRDTDGDVISWDYLPIEADIKNLKSFKVVVLND